jgi:dTDP-glucose 4,6-dehydratase
MKILVTGGAGFIGSNFVHHILNNYKDYFVVNFDKLTYSGNLDNLKSVENNPNYIFIKGDICDKKLVEETITKNKIDTIVHFAAESHVDKSIKDANNFITTNVFGTYVLVDMAKKFNLRFHHISTDEVFGSLGKEGFFNEKTPYAPKSPYAASKAGSDHIVRAYNHTYNVKTTITNCSNNYGPYQFPEKVIPLFVTNLIEGKKVPLYGDGKNVRDWLHVVDHCKAIDLVLHRGKIGEVYCVGGNCEKTNLELTKDILNQFSFGDEKIEYVEDRKGHDFRYAIDFSKIGEELGWKPEYDFGKGLKETIEWYKNNEEWWKKLK